MEQNKKFRKDYEDRALMLDLGDDDLEEVEAPKDNKDF
jgi:hypothetical protein